jgi:hypothetical protein
MTDSNLRELERQFHASGSVEDEAAWLRARAQAGELSEERLELAAYCGHEAAVNSLAVDPLPRSFASALLTGDPRDWPGPTRRSPSAVLLDLVGVSGEGISERRLEPQDRRDSSRSEWDVWFLEHPFASEVFSRVSVAVATVAYRTYVGDRTFGTAEWVTEEMWALEGAVVRSLSTYTLKGEGARSASFEARGTPRQLPAEGVASAATAFRNADRAELLLAAAKAAVASGDVFRSLLREELAPWALGYSDPIRLRVAKRGEVETTP